MSTVSVALRPQDSSLTLNPKLTMPLWIRQNVFLVTLTWEPAPYPPLPPHPRHLGRSQTTVVRLVEKPLDGVRLPRRPWLQSRERSVGPALPDSPLAQGLAKKSGHEDPLYFGHDAQLHQGRMWSSADWSLVSMAPGPQGWAITIPRHLHCLRCMHMMHSTKRIL